jgi:hypothetical protein
MISHFRAALLFRVVGVVIGALALAATVRAQDPAPVELGSVNWLRDLEAAQSQAKTTGKPILLLFQEIPGCETCQKFGNQPLSHPLIVEAIEDLFVPVAIYNNKKGIDEQILKSFKEPAWNNPVIRYLNAEKQDIISRKDRVWDIGGTARRMITALDEAGREVPLYLRLVAAEHSGKTETATFAMHCYWEGEGKLGGLAGVKNTLSGWAGDKEVVDVTFDPHVIDYAALVMEAKKMKCASTVFARSDEQLKVAADQVGDAAERLSADHSPRTAKLSDQKYYLRNSPLRHLPLTALQATRINAALHAGEDVQQFLSPRQLEILSQIKAAVVADSAALEGYVFPLEADDLADYAKRLGVKLQTLAG